ncbi:VOC family protein [Marimonas lutisalis]|uniref:VOC family protein n=1 Tax=Marimonas lutisalis TaxID=2545756 RepID=UPI0010F977ED|nr:VOC family protein [Marimonas lutisalis]
MTDLTGQITWVYCDDLESTCAFYADTLGFMLVRDAGTARIFETTAGAMIGVCIAFEDRIVQPAGGMITLLTDDVDKWYAYLIEEGAALRGPPRELPQFGIYSFFCEDPNGYVIEFQRFVEN